MAKEERIGNPYKNLVFRTSGNIRVLVGDKYYTLKYDTENADDKSSNAAESNFIIAEEGMGPYLSGELEYPGDSKIIFAPGDNIYYTDNEMYLPFDKEEDTEGPSISTTNTFNDTVIFNGNPAFVINGDNTRINNLNAEYLDGYFASDFIKKTDKLEFESIGTSDRNFKVEDGNIIARSISVTNGNIENLSFQNLIGNIQIGSSVKVINFSEFLNSKLISYNVDIFTIIHNLFNQSEIITEDDFYTLASNLFEIINSNYNWTPETVEYMDNSGIVFKPKNLDTWKTIQTKSQGSLYDILSKIIYLETIPAKYNGTGYTIEFSSGTLEIGTEFTFSAENIIYKDKNGNIVNNICTSEYETEESNTVVVNAIVTSVSESTISIVTDLQTYSFKNSHIETSEDYSIINNNEEVIGTYNLSDYTVNEDLSCIPDYYINLDVIGNSIGAIGNLSGITDSIFGELTGNGIYCPENCTLINPNIAWPFLKISNTLAEVKVQDQLWITINRDLGKIETESYLIDSTGLIKTKSATFNVDGSLETKAFTISVDGDFETKAIVINSDGTVTIGDKSGTLQVDEDGILKLI
jgi:hypothetical protein